MEICKTCKSKYNHKIDSRGRIFFPFLNIYQSSLMSYIIVTPTDNFEQSLTFVCCYLVTDRVTQLLKSISDEVFINFKNKFAKVPKNQNIIILLNMTMMII